MNDITSKSRSELVSEEVVSVKPIPIEYFNKRKNRSAKLINNDTEGNFLKGRNSRFEFSFSEPMYISSITVKTKGYPNYKTLEFFWNSIHRISENKEDRRFNEDKATVTVREIVTDFSIKPPKQYFSNPEIESVEVWGLTLSEFGECCEISGKLEKYKESILELCDSQISKATESQQLLSECIQKQNEIEGEISEITAKKNDLQAEADATREKLEEASIAFSEKKSQESDVVSRIEKLEDSIDKKKKESQSLNTEISGSQERLKRLRSDINMFPSEFQGFVTQGGRNILWYSSLALIPMLLLIGYTAVLFSGAIDLTTVYQRKEGLELWSTFLSRLPFVTVSIFMIHACYAISKVFIRELIRINQQRLNLSKISIVAKDIADTAMSDLDLTDDEIYELRTKLKMDLIKSHLKGYIDDSYEYDLEIGLWQKFKRLRKSTDSQIDEANEN
ncbi:MAG: hypothetical protein K6L76_14440 [Agarilytica sp.]